MSSTGMCSAAGMHHEPSPVLNQLQMVLTSFFFMGAQDKKLAEHVVGVHQRGGPPLQNENNQDNLPPELLRAYIAKAKTYEPVIPENLTGDIPAHCHSTSSETCWPC